MGREVITQVIIVTLPILGLVIGLLFGWRAGYRQGRQDELRSWVPRMPLAGDPR